MSRKLHTEEIGEIVKKIREMSITADSAHIRRECRQVKAVLEMKLEFTGPNQILEFIVCTNVQ